MSHPLAGAEDEKYIVCLYSQQLASYHLAQDCGSSLGPLCVGGGHLEFLLARLRQKEKERGYFEGGVFVCALNHAWGVTVLSLAELLQNIITEVKYFSSIVHGRSKYSVIGKIHFDIIGKRTAFALQSIILVKRYRSRSLTHIHTTLVPHSLTHTHTHTHINE